MKTPRYYVSFRNALHGPYEAGDLAEFLTPATLVCREGEDAWRAAADVPELVTILAGAARAATDRPPGASYLVRVDEKEYGPYSLEQLKEFAKASTPVRAAADSEWRPAAEIEGLAGFFSAGAPTGGVETAILKDWFFFDAAGARHGPYTRREIEDLLRREVLAGEMKIQHLNWPAPRPLRSTLLYRDVAAPTTAGADVGGARRARRYLAAAGVALLLVLAGAVARRGGPSPGAPPPAGRAPAEEVGGLLATAAYAVGDADGSSGEFFTAPIPAPDTALDRLMVKVVDVGQGDGIVIRTPGGRVYVVDAGPRAGALVPCLEALGVEEIEAVLLTHPHSDHYAGIPAILERWPVKTFYDPGVPHTSAGYARLLKTVLERDIDYVNPRAGDVYDWGDGVRVEILHPDSPAYGNLNDNSIVFRLAFDATTMLFAGDAELAAHRAVLARHRDRLASDVYKVGHHGSHNATTAEWLDAIRPRTAVISCGLSNQFGHPRAAVVDLLRERGIQILRTDFMGGVTLVSNGTNWTATVEANPYDRVARSPDTAAVARFGFDAAAVLESRDWDRIGPRERFSARGGALAITAPQGEGIGAAGPPAPLLLRRPPEGERWLVVADMPTTGEAGALVLYGDEENWMALGAAEGGEVDLVSSRRGRRDVARLRPRAPPRYLAMERFGDRLNLAVSADRNEWSVLCRLPFRKLNLDPGAARIGLSAVARGEGPAQATFAGLEEYVR